jgi:hypothetical protein
MSIDDVGGGFLIVLAGVVISFLVLAVELHVDKFGFPFSYIWTNKPHRSWPSTRELHKKGLLGNQSETFSLAPLELSLSQRRLTPSVRDPWHSLAIDGLNEMNKGNRRLIIPDGENTSRDISRRSFSISQKNDGYNDDYEEDVKEQDSGRSSLSNVIS